MALGANLVVCKFKEPHPAAAPWACKCWRALCCAAEPRNCLRQVQNAELELSWVRREQAESPGIDVQLSTGHKALSYPKVCWLSTDGVGQILVAPVVTSDGYPEKLSEQCEASGSNALLSIKPCLRRKKKVLKITHPIKGCIRLSLRGGIQTAKAKITISVLC